MTGAAPLWDVRLVAETGSTNSDIMDAAASGAAHGRVLVTDHQTAGRGRLDRRWDAPPGANLLVSVLFREGFDRTVPHQLTQRVALAAVATSVELAGVRPELKWPNDLLLDGRKLAGILAQAGDVTSDGVGFVVVGMGLNLGWAPEGAARLDGVGRDDFLASWLAHLARRWAEPVHGPYREALATIGRRVRVQQADGELVGDAIDVTAAGELVVDVDGQRVVVAVGDVVHLRLAD